MFTRYFMENKSSDFIFCKSALIKKDYRISFQLFGEMSPKIFCISQVKLLKVNYEMTI